MQYFFLVISKLIFRNEFRTRVFNVYFSICISPGFYSIWAVCCAPVCNTHFIFTVCFSLTVESINVWGVGRLGFELHEAQVRVPVTVVLFRGFTTAMCISLSCKLVRRWILMRTILFFVFAYSCYASDCVVVPVSQRLRRIWIQTLSHVRFLVYKAKNMCAV